MYILVRTVAHGRRVGLASAWGVCTGALVHVTAAALGISAVLATSATAFRAVKYAGAAYLVYLGIKTWRSRHLAAVSESPATSAITPWRAFAQGVLVDVLNPKVAIFFMAFLPQFVRPALGHVTQQLFVLGLTVVAVAVVVESSFALAAGRANRFVRRHPAWSVWMDRVVGSVLVALGLRLARASTP